VNIMRQELLSTLVRGSTVVTDVYSSHIFNIYGFLLLTLFPQLCAVMQTESFLQTSENYEYTSHLPPL